MSMTQNIVERTEFPRTRQTLANDLHKLGVKAGMSVLVHSSLSQFGWVNGGETAVIFALMDVLTPDGTLMMPTHTPNNSDPAEWQAPPVPTEWHETIRQTRPAFDPLRTPCTGVGKIPELFRTWPDVYRSDHPHLSFAAWGRQAQFITQQHELTYGLGETSPLARLYDLDGHILLLGVGYNRCTQLHLAEYRSGVRDDVQCGARMWLNGRSVWQPYTDIALDETEFPEIGQMLEQQGVVTVGQVGSAESRLFGAQTAVDQAVHFFKEKI